MESEKLQLFEDQRIRTAWDEENEEWYFSIVDVVGALTESSDFDTSRKYWNKSNKEFWVRVPKDTDVIFFAKKGKYLDCYKDTNGKEKIKYLEA